MPWCSRPGILARTVLLAVTAASAAACGPATPKDPDAAPTLTGKTLTGEYWSSLDVRGKVVLVNVWATWCEPCRAELPVLAAVHQKYGGSNFEVVGVSVDAEADVDEVRAMAGRAGLGYPVVLDPGKRVTLDWNIEGYPTSVLLDHKGHVVWRKTGELRRDDAELSAKIEAALRDTPGS